MDSIEDIAKAKNQPTSSSQLRGTTSITKTYSKILDDMAPTVIANAIESINVTKKAYDEAKRAHKSPIPWGYTIHDSLPLRFIPTEVPNSSKLQVDIYCEIYWADDELPVKQDIKVRIWGLHEDTIYRKDFDAERISTEFKDETKPHLPRPHKKSRVVSRLHFDKANPGQRGPYYHLQFGGKSHSYELCWHPEKVNVPRLEFQPMDLFLTCQMVAANFFHEKYIEIIRKKREWLEQVKWCQNIFLRPHYRQCFKALDETQTTLLDELWGIKNS